MTYKEQRMVIDLFLPGDCPCAYEAMSGSGKLITKCNFTFSKCLGTKCNQNMTRAEAVERMATGIGERYYPERLKPHNKNIKQAIENWCLELAEAALDALMRENKNV